MNEQAIDSIETVIENVSKIIMGIKAQGGYKFRTQLLGTEVEINDFVARSAPRLYEMAIRLTVLEDLIKNSSIMDRCEEEYRRRLDEASLILTARQKEKEKAHARRQTA